MRTFFTAGNGGRGDRVRWILFCVLSFTLLPWGLISNDDDKARFFSLANSSFSRDEGPGGGNAQANEYAGFPAAGKGFSSSSSSSFIEGAIPGRRARRKQLFSLPNAAPEDFGALSSAKGNDYLRAPQGAFPEDAEAAQALESDEFRATRDPPPLASISACVKSSAANLLKYAFDVFLLIHHQYLLKREEKVESDRKAGARHRGAGGDGPADHNQGTDYAAKGGDDDTAAGTTSHDGRQAALVADDVDDGFAGLVLDAAARMPILLGLKGIPYESTLSHNVSEEAIRDDVKMNAGEANRKGEVRASASSPSSSPSASSSSSFMPSRASLRRWELPYLKLLQPHIRMTAQLEEQLATSSRAEPTFVSDDERQALRALTTLLIESGRGSLPNEPENADVYLSLLLDDDESIGLWRSHLLRHLFERFTVTSCARNRATAAAGRPAAAAAVNPQAPPQAAAKVRKEEEEEQTLAVKTVNHAQDEEGEGETRQDAGWGEEEHTSDGGGPSSEPWIRLSTIRRLLGPGTVSPRLAIFGISNLGGIEEEGDTGEEEHTGEEGKRQTFARQFEAGSDRRKASSDQQLVEEGAERGAGQQEAKDNGSLLNGLLGAELEGVLLVSLQELRQQFWMARPATSAAAVQMIRIAAQRHQQEVEDEGREKDGKQQKGERVMQRQRGQAERQRSDEPFRRERQQQSEDAEDKDEEAEEEKVKTGESRTHLRKERRTRDGSNTRRKTGAQAAMWEPEVSMRFRSLSMKDAQRMMGTFLTSNLHPDMNFPRGKKLPPKKVADAIRWLKAKTGWTAGEDRGVDDDDDDDLPQRFDAREAFPACKEVIGHVRDQGSCGSCWAFSSTASFNDRLCIRSGGEQKQLLSPQHTTSCCNAAKCQSYGCNGGDPGFAWRWFSREGVVSGGDYDTLHKGTTCWPYELPPCNHHANAPFPDCKKDRKSWTTPRCRADCLESEYTKNVRPFAQDRHRAARSYSFPSPKHAKKDMKRAGSISGAFIVYEDFLTYKSGVYKHVYGLPVGGHATKLIGWGSENGEEYWLAVNSWNSYWGDNGLFKIKFGEAGIDDDLIAGDVVWEPGAEREKLKEADRFAAKEADSAASREL